MSGKYFVRCQMKLNNHQSTVPSPRLSVLRPPIEIVGVEAVEKE